MRKEGELDKLLYFCNHCNEILYERSFQCRDMGTQLAAAMREVYESESIRTCKKCGTVMPVPGLRK